jgi:hypothetical protein
MAYYAKFCFILLVVLYPMFWRQLTRDKLSREDPLVLFAAIHRNVRILKHMAKSMTKSAAYEFFTASFPLFRGCQHRRVLDKPICRQPLHLAAQGGHVDAVSWLLRLIDEHHNVAEDDWRRDYPDYGFDSSKCDWQVIVDQVAENLCSDCPEQVVKPELPRLILYPSFTLYQPEPAATAIQLAIANRHETTAKVLMEHHWPPVKHGLAVIHMIAEHGSQDFIDWISNKFPYDQVQGCNGMNVLHLLAYQKAEECACTATGAAPPGCRCRKYKSFCVARATRYVKIVKKLLEMNVDLEGVTEYQEWDTPLVQALSAGEPDLARALIRCGAQRKIPELLPPGNNDDGYQDVQSIYESLLSVSFDDEFREKGRKKNGAEDPLRKLVLKARGDLDAQEKWHEYSDSTGKIHKVRHRDRTKHKM